MNDENSESKSNTHGRHLYETGLSICEWVKSGDLELYWIICVCQGGYPLNVGGDFLYMQHSVNFFSLAKA